MERSETEMCPICLERYQRPRKMAEIICKNKHKMCGECLDTLLTSTHISETCPQCRQPLIISKQRFTTAQINKHGGVRIESSSLDLIMPFPRSAVAQPMPRLYQVAAIVLPNQLPPIDFGIHVAAAVPVEPIHPVRPAIRRIVPSSRFLVFLLRIVAVLLVWGSTAANIYFYLNQSIFVLVLLYILLCQFFTIATNMNRMHSSDPHALLMRQLIRQLMFFTMSENFWQRTRLRDFIYHLKEVGLIALAVLISILSKHWTVAAINNIMINSLALVVNILIEKFVLDITITAWCNWLSVYQCLRSSIIYALYVYCYVYFGFSMYVLWQLSQSAFGIQIMACLVFSLSTLRFNGHLNCQNRLKDVVTLPFACSTLMNSICWKGWVWMAFIVRYIQLPVLFGVTLYFQLIGRGINPNLTVPSVTAVFLMSLFSPIELIIGSLV